MFKSNIIIPVILLLIMGAGIFFMPHTTLSKADLIRKSRLINNIQIIERIADDRGLTSVIYVQSGDTLALDYLTQEELNTLCKH